jgi:hypothetical protein
MGENTAPATRVLAVNDIRWCIFSLPDGNLQLDMGAVALMLSRHEFEQLCQLTGHNPDEIPAARAARLNQEKNSRGLFYCSHHDRLGLLFNNLFLRLHRPEFSALADLCRKAAQALGPAENKLIDLPKTAPGFSAN